VFKSWDDDAWADYLYWQTQDKKTLKRIHALIKDIERSPYEGIGKPEPSTEPRSGEGSPLAPLKYDLSGYWSRRIDESNRIVYRIKEDRIEIIQCGAHYRDS